MTRQILRQAFTIVELIVVVVVIAVLATIVIVAYNGVTNNANTAALQSNLSTMAQQLDNYAIHNGGLYPSTLAAGDINVPDKGTYQYRSVDSSTYCLQGFFDENIYRVTDDNPTPTGGVCSGILADGSICPDGFIAVPGNAVLGTDDFCIMKYEAKIVGQSNGNQTYDSSFVAESRASGTPWVNISQTNAITESAAVCGGCHLVTEAEWMTVAANVLSVPSNWSSGTIGSGYMFQGHVNFNPSSPIEASADDNDGLYGMTSTGNTVGTNSRRTLNLTNGEVVWDFTGNVWESTQIAIGTPTLVTSNIGIPGDSGFSYRQWNNPLFSYGNLPTESRPTTLASIPGLSQISSWDSSNGIGQVYANYSANYTYALRRGGDYGNTGGQTYAGVTTLNLINTAPSTSTTLGFRVAK